MNFSRPTIMEVDLRAFEENLSKIQNLIGKNVKIMPVIKANAYGTYINQNLDILNKFDIVAVACVCEAINLRNLGYEKDIFVLNQSYIGEIEDIIKYNITIGISDDDFLDALIKTKASVKIHLEIETGMGRTGIKKEDIIPFIEKAKNSKLEIEGIYTHFSSADIDFEYTKGQIKTFNEVLEKAQKHLNFKYIHSSASNGILNFGEANYNLVRPGIILYGYGSENFKPICKLKSKITFLKEVEKGTYIGYSKKYMAKFDMKVATIPIGYADGLPRALSNKGYVVIENKKVPIIGSVCMDSIMVDVTDIENVHINQDVYIWDNNIITVNEIAKKIDTIEYEILSQVSQRVPRIFV